MTTTEKAPSERKRKQPRVLRKEIKRLRGSRDNLKEKNKERAKVVKDIKDRLRETQNSRGNWKSEVKELKLVIKRLMKELEQNEAKDDEIALLYQELKKKLN